MDYCNVTKQIIQFPKEDVKKWGILKVRDFLVYKSHVKDCMFCSTLIDAFLNEHKDEPQRIDPTSLN